MIRLYPNPITDSPLPEVYDFFTLDNDAPDLQEQQDSGSLSPYQEVEKDRDYKEGVQVELPTLTKKDLRKIKNRDAARDSRKRKQMQLDRLEKIESSISQFGQQVHSLLAQGLQSELGADLKRLTVLSETDAVGALKFLQTLFMKTITKNALFQVNSSPMPEEPAMQEEILSVSLLRQCIAKKPTDYGKAFELSKKLFFHFTHNHLKANSPHALLKCFVELTERGQDTLSQPFFAWIHFALARMYEIKGTKDKMEIVAGYERALDLGCHEAAAYLADALEAQGVNTQEERARIIELYQKAGTSETLYNLGFIYQKGWAATSLLKEETYDDALVNLEFAEAYFRQSYIKDPNNYEAITSIAETIFMDTERLTDERRIEAMTLYQQAIDQGSQEACYLLALVYRKLGQHDQAIQTLTKINSVTCDAALYKEASALLQVCKDSSMATMSAPWFQ